MYSKDLFIERAQLALLDAMVVFAAFLGAAWARHGETLFAPGPDGSIKVNAYLFPATLVALVFVLIFRYEGLYSMRFGRFAEAFRLIRGAALGTMIVLAVMFFYRDYSYSRATIVIFTPLALALLIATRSLYRGYRRFVQQNPAARRRVLIVGFGSIGQRLGRSLLEQPSYYDLRGFLDDDPVKAGAMLEDSRVLGSTAELAGVVKEQGIDEVIIAMPSAPSERVTELLGACLRLKVRWKVVPALYDLLIERVHFDEMGGLPLVGLRGSSIVGFNWALKRVFDLALSTLLLLAATPLLLLIALAIKVTSRGPVLYRQARVGLAGRPFTFLKFRSMRAGSDAGIHQSYATSWIYGRTGGSRPGPVSGVAVATPVPRSVGAAASDAFEAAPGVHKMTHDPRVTLVGRLLRKTSLDELPQLWNVARGEMSLVGPRPAIPYEVERYSEWHKRRLGVLPGITGLWQVSGRNALSFDRMVRLDIEYIETWSMEQDLKILLKTAPALLFGKAY